MTEQVPWLREVDVAELVSIREAIDGLEAGLRDVGQGSAVTIPKALATLDNGASLHALGSALPAQGYGGFKTWVHTAQGAKAVFALFDVRRGALLAMMEAGALGQLRTAAMTGLGTRWLAPEAADDMALIGTGRQAMGQVAAVHAVRPLKRLRVWSPTAASRARFIDSLRTHLDIEIVDAPTIAQATEGASIVTVVTRAREPFFPADYWPKNSHLNAVGAILPTHAELLPGVAARARLIVADDTVAVRKVSRELREHFGEADDRWQAMAGLAQVIAGVTPVPRAPGALFKSVGMGISDLSVAITVLQRARERGLGTPLQVTDVPPLRW